MKPSIRNYLGFNNIWTRKEEYNSHISRLKNISKTDQNMRLIQKHELITEEVKNYQIINSRRQELYKWRQIQKTNGVIVSRLESLKSPYTQSPLNTSHSSVRSNSLSRITNKKEEKRIYEANSKLQKKVMSIQSSLKAADFMKDYQRYKKQRLKMEKFVKSPCSPRTFLKAQLNVEKYHQAKLSENKKRVYSIEMSKSEKNKFYGQAQGRCRGLSNTNDSFYNKKLLNQQKKINGLRKNVFLKELNF